MCRGLQAFCRHCVRCHYTNEGHSRYKKYQRVRFWKNKIIAYRVRCAFAYRSASCVEWHFSLIYSHRSHDWGEKKHFQLPPQHFPSAICILREKSVHTYKRVMRKKKLPARFLSQNKGVPQKNLPKTIISWNSCRVKKVLSGRFFVCGHALYITHTYVKKYTRLHTLYFQTQVEKCFFVLRPEKGTNVRSGLG